MRNLLLFLLLLFVIFQVRRSFVRKPPATRAPEEGPDAGAAVPPQAIESEEVLPCAHCGLHVPETEGLRAQGRFYCSAAHRDLGPHP